MKNKIIICLSCKDWTYVGNWDDKELHEHQKTHEGDSSWLGFEEEEIWKSN